MKLPAFLSFGGVARQSFHGVSTPDVAVTQPRQSQEQAACVNKDVAVILPSGRKQGTIEYAASTCC